MIGILQKVGLWKDAPGSLMVVQTQEQRDIDVRGPMTAENAPNSAARTPSSP